MSMAVNGNTDLAEVALSEAMNYVLWGADPWKVSRKEIKRLKEAFRPDFVDEIKTLRDYNRWAPKIEVLFRSSGQMAAIFAEAQRQKLGKPAGTIGWDELVLGVILVRVLLCPKKPGRRKAGPLEPEGKICDGVSFLQGDLRATLAKAMARIAPEF
jgi:hypothetical protein